MPGAADFTLAVREAVEVYAKTGRLGDAALLFPKHDVATFPCDPVTKVPIPRRDPDPTGKFKRGIPGTGRRQEGDLRSHRHHAMVEE